MHNRTLVTLALSLPLAAVVWGCSSSSAPPPAATGDTFAQFYSGVIMSYGCTDCHVPGGPGVEQGMLDMSTPAKAYADLVNVKAMGTGCGTSGLTRVIPGNAAQSLIVLKTEKSVNGTAVPCGSQMPLGCPTKKFSCLGPDDVKTLESWINGGAPAPVD